MHHIETVAREECATQPAMVDEALRWRAYLIAVVEDEGDGEVAVYFSECGCLGIAQRLWLTTSTLCPSGSSTNAP
jgi:hypothetical protein